MLLKGSLMQVAPACATSREGSDHFGSYIRSLSLHFYKRLFPGFDQQLYKLNMLLRDKNYLGERRFEISSVQ
jgi:hypothetical protein